jgi:Icc-related predicted phosphoesterase
MPRILAFVDLHGSVRGAEALVRLAAVSKPNVIVCAGDFSECGDFCAEALRRLARIGLPVHWVPGNHEDSATSARLSRNWPFLIDLSCARGPVMAAGIALVGLSEEDGILPGGHEDGETAEATFDLWRRSGTPHPLALVTHYPPAGCRIDGRERRGGRGPNGHREAPPDAGGSRLVRRAVEEFRPALVVCGHYHAMAGVTAHVGESLIVNPGPTGMVLEINGRSARVAGAVHA